MFGRKKTHTKNRRQVQEPSMWRHVGYGALTCSIVTLLITTMWYVTRLPSLTIASVHIQGGETISHDEIQTVIDQVFQGSYLKIIPYRFTLLYPDDALRAGVASVSRVHDVVIARSGRTSLAVTFTEYEPFALWCSDKDDTALCYFLDATGYAFAPGPQLQGGTLARHILEGQHELEKKQAFETSAFVKTHAFLERLSYELGLRITDVLYTKDGDIQLSVNGGGGLIIRDDESYDKTFENIRSILDSKEFKHLKPGNFQYIDLRFGNKIFVNEELILSDEVGTSTATTT